MRTENSNGGIFRGLTLRIRLLGLSVLMIVPFTALMFYLMFSMNRISDSYSAIVRNITQVNSFNIVFKEDMDSVMYMMIAHSLSKYEVKNELGMDNPDVMIRAAEETFEEVRANTESAEAKARLTSAIKLLITLHKRVNDISDTVKEIGHYDENMERLDMDIRVITDMIQDRIAEYLYYESVSLENIRQEMNARRKLLTSSAIMTTALLLVLSLWISALITRSITHPIAGLIEASDQIGAGNLDARAEVTGSPEIRTLADRFNSMAARIGELVENNRQEQIHLRNMELKLLQSQINPHFLYNTLDNIVWLAEDDRKEDVEKIAKALSAFFRSALSSGRDIIRISEEVRHVESYLEIQGYRYRDMLTYEIQVDPECGQYEILKMTIQPIVENALYHGIKNRRGGGSILVRISRREDRMEILVKDTGIGMRPEKVEQLNRMTKGLEKPDQETGSFAVYNVAERLRLYYGEAAGITFTSVYGEGTEATIRIPCMQERNIPVPEEKGTGI